MGRAWCRCANEICSSSIPGSIPSHALRSSLIAKDRTNKPLSPLPPSWGNHKAAYAWWDRWLSDREEDQRQKYKRTLQRLIEDQPSTLRIVAANLERSDAVVEGHKGNFKPLLKLLHHQYGVPLDLLNDIKVI
jgi:hypothetical protein